MQDKKLGPFLGLNNMLPSTKMEEHANGRKVGDFLSRADNVDITDVGTLRRRPGYQLKLEGKDVRGLFGLPDGTALVAEYATLYRLDYQGETLLRDALMADLLPGASIAYALDGTGVFISDGVGLWRYEDGKVEKVGIALPQWTPQLQASAGGSLPAGLYQVAITLRRADGQESGTSITQQIAVPANGVLNITNLPQTADVGVSEVCIYASPTNGDALYFQQAVALGTSSAQFTSHTDGGGRCFTHKLHPMPAGRILCLHKARLLAAQGAVLFKSQPFAFGLYDPVADFIPFAAPITVLESVDTGLYVVADKTYFIEGDFESVREVSPLGAAFGSSVRLPDQNGVYWFSDQGMAHANSAGELRLLHDERITVSPAQAAALLVREENGLSQVLAAARNSSGADIAAARSFMDVEVIKQGVTT